VTDDPTAGGRGQPDPAERPDEAPWFTDKRRIDPETGAVREPAAGAGDPVGADAEPDPLAGLDFEPGGTDADPLGANALAAELVADLQRVQAEYVNYRKRVERDRTVARDQAVSGMVESLIPVLDDIELARRHGELDGTPFATIAEKLESTLERFGWERYGEVGEVFDPQVHEALMHQHSDEVTEPTVSVVMQLGHRVAGRVVRAARVAVADPDA
jgi:molecular chaperone GrpE